ncbi:MAG: RluA family pseudouridine synthase [Clostridia bacterium]|nr:RluA family pseudouridine synthase [Clostridia bacterium]
MEFLIAKEDDGKVLKSFLIEQLHPSKKLLRSVKFREDGILLNGSHVTVRAILQEGDRLSIALDDAEAEERIDPVDLPLTILYEDEDLVVPSKPANMPTHPSCDHHFDTVANALAYRYRECGTPYVFRPVNRLDRNTSGLLVVAKNRLSAGRMAKSLQKGEFSKEYLAILDGVLSEDAGTLCDYLHRTEKSIILREVCEKDAPGAEFAKTEFWVLFRGERHTLVLARPITGRTHQLRVQFAHHGFPISGDDLYGTPSESILRHALHALRISFPHPTTKERLTVLAPPPADFSNFAKKCFGNDFELEPCYKETFHE